uniref:Putative secreted protein n=1 Tax=Anopheles triannulatus TaxID=58253 RepID=A0A2M4B6T7_9DIPT
MCQAAAAAWWLVVAARGGRQLLWWWSSWRGGQQQEQETWSFVKSPESGVPGRKGCLLIKTISHSHRLMR